jgi:hypothetical protein
MNGYPQSW